MEYLITDGYRTQGFIQRFDARDLQYFVNIRTASRGSKNLTMQKEWTKNFFISYTRADLFWAEWIAWELEEDGYETVLQAWDFRPGDNFIDLMNRATKEAERIIAVLSQDYLTASYPLDEWSVGLVKAQGKGGRLVPVRVRECDPEGLLSAIIHIDLVGVSEQEARNTLLNGVRKGRIKPSVKPSFPGSFPGTLPPVWNIPHNRNLHFTGRDDFLADLYKLTSRTPPALAQAIVGQAGVGKTQIAVEYAYRHAADYKVVWWLRAEALATDYTSLARALKLPEKDVSDQNAIVTSVQRWLGLNTNWLFIFDNVQNQAEVRNYLPQAGTGHVLITSRNPNWQGMADTLTVRVMETNDAADFLLKRMEKVDESNRTDRYGSSHRTG